MKNTKILLILLLTLTVLSCKKDPVDPSIPSNIPEGISYSPEAPDADQELTITFKAGSTSQLYGYSGDVYVHVGVVVEGVWQYVPASWNQNIAKCKMTFVKENVWEIKLSPSIRLWFNSGETAINSIGLVIRSSDGNKKGIAEDSFITVSDTKYKGFQPAEIKRASLPTGVEDGINVVDNSTVTLVFYDKDKNGNHKDFAHVVGDFNDWKLTNDDKSQMFRDDAAGCWWITLTGLDATKEYAFQYYVGTKAGEIIRTGDPYAEKILDPHHDGYITDATYPENKTSPPKAIGISSVFKIQKDNYAWKVPNFTIPNPNKLVIYEMLLRDFTTAGNLTGAMAKLDYLKTLGINAVQLMPVQEFDGNDSWGYNPAYFFAMDKAYGTRTMYKEFIDACHERGMAVILDVVYNHATGSHPFAKLYWDSGKNKTSPNNPWFNVDAPHPYSVFHDFNHESPLVRNYVKRNIDFLLKEYKFDGFRFDLTKGFTQKSSNESTAGNYDASRIAILNDYYSQVKASNPNAMMILEHFCDDPEERELTDAGMYVWGNKNTAYSETAMGWSTPSKTSFNGINAWTRSWTNNNVVGYMESHDEERNMYAAKTWGIDVVKNSTAIQMKRAALNAAFLLTIPGPKMIWQFGELGYDVSINEDGRTSRKPILWNYFDIPERKMLYETYSKLNVVRENISSTFDDRTVWTTAFSGNDWAEGRRIVLNSPAKKMVVLGNFRTDAAINMVADFPVAGVWKDEMANATITVTDVKMEISIPAHEFKVFTFDSN